MTTQAVEETETAASGEYTDRFITLNGCRHHYQDWGNPEAPPLLMVHGLTQHSHSFDGVARHFRERYHCIALDVRGRGESDWASEESYGYDTYARDVAALLEALEIPAAHYLGTSMGGLIAMTLAIGAPEKFLGLALNDIGPHLGQAGIERIGGYVKDLPDRYDSLDDYLDQRLFPAFPWLAKRPREPLLRAAQWTVKPDGTGGYKLRMDPLVTAGIGADPEAMAAFEGLLWKGFGNLSCPILLIRGAESMLLEPGTVEEMRIAQPKLAVASVAGVGHAPSLDEPEAREALEAFFG
ncbi:MAG: alpha/beta hydrolase [bacterium]